MKPACWLTETLSEQAYCIGTVCEELPQWGQVRAITWRMTAARW